MNQDHGQYEKRVVDIELEGTMKTEPADLLISSWSGPVVTNPDLITDSNFSGQQVNSRFEHIVKAEPSLVLESSDTSNTGTHETTAVPMESLVPPCDVVNVIHVIPLVNETVGSDERGALNEQRNLVIISSETVHGNTTTSETFGQIIGNTGLGYNITPLPESSSSVPGGQLQIKNEPDDDCIVEKSTFDLTFESTSNDAQATESAIAETTEADDCLLPDETTIQINKACVSRPTVSQDVHVGLFEVEVDDLLHTLPNPGRETEENTNKNSADIKQVETSNRPSAVRQSAKRLTKERTKQSAKPSTRQSAKQSAKQSSKQSESSLGTGGKTPKQHAGSKKTCKKISTRLSTRHQTRDGPPQSRKICKKKKKQRPSPEEPPRFKGRKSNQEEDGLLQSGTPGNKKKKQRPSREDPQFEGGKSNQEEDGLLQSGTPGNKKKKQCPTRKDPQFEGGKSNQEGDLHHKCNQCDATFAQHRHLVWHNRLHHDKQSFFCDQCAKTFSRRHLLLEHKRIHEGKGQFVCAECGKAFTSNWHFQHHKLTHSAERPFACDECPQSFKSEVGLKSHKMIHSGTSRPFQCEWCGNKFLRLSHMQEHQRTHTGEKPFRCDECGRRFTRSNHLNSHKHIHSDEKPFKCKICEKLFGVQRNLTVHMRVHTGERPHKCDFQSCTKAFTSSGDLKRHKRSHTGERPYGCVNCDKRFRQSSRIKQHKCTGVKASLEFDK